MYNSSRNEEDSNDTTTSSCRNEYQGSHCSSALQSYTLCDSPASETSVVYVSNVLATDLETAEDGIGQVLFALETVIKPSDECRSAVIPFLCLYTFGVCGVNNDDYRPTVAQSMEIRDSICESEWRKAADLLALTGGTPLPDCSSLREQGLPIYVPLTLYAKGGFTFARFPPIICVGTNIDANFYTVIFPTTILYAVGTTMLLLIVWKVRRVSSLALHVSHFEVKCVTL